MPNRCGIMHARGTPPSSQVLPKEIQDYCASFENKIGSFLQPLNKLTPEEAKKLGTFILYLLVGTEQILRYATKVGKPSAWRNCTAWVGSVKIFDRQKRDVTLKV